MSASEIAELLIKEWAAQGKIIEGGFASMRAVAMHPDSPDDQVREMRMAFFAGAQHLFASIMTILDPGEEPTDADLQRMGLIQKELDEFITEFSKKHLPTKGNA